MVFNYRQSVLSELARHGVAPRADTPPELIRDFINDLYVYEIRTLRGRLKDGAIALSDYATQVEKLRNRYPVLSLPIRFWIEGE